MEAAVRHFDICNISNGLLSSILFNHCSHCEQPLDVYVTLVLFSIEIPKLCAKTKKVIKHLLKKWATSPISLIFLRGG